MEQNQSNPNDFKVVQFHNSTDFDFTPEMGCMYDSRPVFGISGESCIKAGETMTLPYHIGMLLAQNLAKAVMVRKAPVTDAPGIPTGVPLWDTAKLDQLKNSFIKELYSEQKPIAQTETDRLMAQVEAYKKIVEDALPQLRNAQAAQAGNVPGVDSNIPVVSPDATVIPSTDTNTAAPLIFQDKGEVIAELERRNISHDRRKNKVELEKLLQAVPVTE